MQKVYFEGKTPAFDIAAGPVPGEMHLAAGQEPVAAGVCAHLRPDRRRDRHPPAAPHRARPRHGHEAAGRRDLRQGHGPGPRQGRPHAPVRRRHELRLQRHHRRRDADRRRRRAGVQEAGAGTTSRCRSSARAPPTRGRSTSRSTWRHSGCSRWSSSARTTPGRSACPRTRRVGRQRQRPRGSLWDPRRARPRQRRRRRLRNGR